MPGTNPTEIQDSGIDDTSGTSSAGIGMKGSDSGDSSGTGGLGNGSLSLNQNNQGSGNGAVTLEVGGDKVGVSAVDETNTLLVRSTGAAWRSIREVIERLDVMPLQVHIEAQVAEVKLGGNLQYGVSWYFQNILSGLIDSPITAGAGIRRVDGTTGLVWSFPGSNSVAVIKALDQVTDVRLLQTPSVVVRNNVEATFNVGTRIPIQSVTVNTNTGSGDTFSQVQYLDTGVILKVRPRITKDSTVFLEVVQEVSSPGPVPATCLASNGNNCNVSIDTRRLKTEAAIQSG